MRCQICDQITENSQYNEATEQMDSICGKCSGVIAETITEDEITFEDERGLIINPHFYDAVSKIDLDFEGFGEEE